MYSASVFLSLKTRKDFENFNFSVILPNTHSSSKHRDHQQNNKKTLNTTLWPCLSDLSQEQSVFLPKCLNTRALCFVLQMVTHYISHIIPEQAGHAGWESISWKIQNRRLLPRICSLHHTKWRYLSPAAQTWSIPDVFLSLSTTLFFFQQLLNPVKTPEWRELSSSSETSFL